MRLYVGNLAFTTSEIDLQDAFGQYGTVTDVKIMQDHGTGRSRGFGFVTMSSAAEGEAAAQAFNGQELDGRRLTVNEARPREDRPSGGGGRPQRSFSGSGSRRY